MPRRIRGYRMVVVVFYVTTHITAPLVLADDRGAGDTAPVGEQASTSSTQSLEVAGVNVRLDFLATDFRHGTGQIVSWIERSVDIVAAYYGRFPTAQLHPSVAERGRRRASWHGIWCTNAADPAGRRP